MMMTGRADDFRVLKELLGSGVAFDDALDEVSGRERRILRKVRYA